MKGLSRKRKDYLFVLGFVIAYYIFNPLLNILEVSSYPLIYSENSTNDTSAGEPIEFRLKWEDLGATNLSGFVFSWINGTYHFLDRFNRPNSDDVGNGWIDNDYNDATVSISGNTLKTNNAGYGEEIGMDEAYANRSLSVLANVSVIGWIKLSKEDAMTMDYGIYLMNSSGSGLVFAQLINYGGESTNRLYFAGGLIPTYLTHVDSNLNYHKIEIKINNSGDHIAYLYYDDVLKNYSVMSRSLDDPTEIRVLNDVSGNTVSGDARIGYALLENFTIIENHKWLEDDWSNINWDSSVEWSNVTHVVNPSVNKTIKWQIYANDTSDVWNVSGIYSFNTTLTTTTTSTTSTSTTTTIYYVKPIEDKRILCYHLLSGNVTKSIYHQENLRDANSENLDDARVYEGLPGGNYGNRWALDVGVSVGGSSESCIKFNISSIPPNSLITDARIYLRLTQNDLDSGESISTNIFHVYNRSHYNISNNEWTEETLNWNNRPNLAFQTNLTYEDSLDFDENSSIGWYSWNVTRMVKESYNSQDQNISMRLNGTWISGIHDVVDVLHFSGKEDEEVNNRPYLIVTYNTSTIIEEMVKSDFSKIAMCDLIEYYDCFVAFEDIEDEELRLSYCIDRYS